MSNEWTNAMRRLARLAREQYGPDDPKVVPWHRVVFLENWPNPNRWAGYNLYMLAHTDLPAAQKIITKREPWLLCQTDYSMLHTEAFYLAHAALGYTDEARQSVADAMRDISPEIDWSGADEFLAAMNLLDQCENESEIVVPDGIVIPGLDGGSDETDDEDARKRCAICDWAEDIVGRYGPIGDRRAYEYSVPEVIMVPLYERKIPML